MASRGVNEPTGLPTALSMHVDLFFDLEKKNKLRKRNYTVSTVKRSL